MIRNNLIRVIKLGGSLLNLESFPAKLSHWLEQQPMMFNVIIVGGGLVVEKLRQQHQVEAIDSVDAHWQAVRLMSSNCQTISNQLPDYPLVEKFHDIKKQLSKSRGILFDVDSFLHHEEPHLPGTPLPQSWQVTSDSIAARVAESLPVDELVLLKSTLPKNRTVNLNQLADSYVDQFFPTASLHLIKIRLVNLRSVDFSELIVR